MGDFFRSGMVDREWFPEYSILNPQISNLKSQISNLLPGNNLLWSLDAEFCFELAEGVDEDEGELHEEIPCGKFGKMDGLPAVFLAGILPSTRDGAKVFGEVDEEGDEAEAQKQGHA